MSEGQSIMQSSATGEEVTAAVAQLEDAIVGLPHHVGIIALLAMALTLMKPDITQEGIHNGVRDVSQFICLLLEGDQMVEEGNKPKVTLN